MLPFDDDRAVTGPVVTAPRPGLEVRSRATGTGALVCALVGDLDVETLAAAAETLAALVARRPAAVVIDLREVAFCDSSGLNLLLRTRIEAEKVGLDLRLAAVAPTVMRVLELTGARTVFSIHDSVEAALES
ncbi:STAS domain-containing protein [Streptomyces sp. SP17BM10]|uniref:STAS domain-containing protein n=1 Tax=Streptomyces sp. SP17BM10 TaxID=3002530 RepID=UPI002E783A90|nr:STAS domain-containing protein [Streptomyces sp. SP17BM10]MEE1782616.1 STAS domain-containing protein [Streptomyces sp. SP17BM10]